MSSPWIKEATIAKIRNESQYIEKLKIKRHEQVKLEMKLKAEQRHKFYLSALQEKNEKWKQKTLSSPLNKNEQEVLYYHNILKKLNIQAKQNAMKKEPAITRPIKPLVVQKVLSPTDKKLIQQSLSIPEQQILQSIHIGHDIKRAEEEKDKLSRSINKLIQEGMAHMKI
jgi:hypothetical protein